MRRIILLGIGVPLGLSSVVALRVPSVEAADRETLAAARQAAQQLNLPTIQVYSRETVVDVTVTDAKGNPVHGLTRDDFTVKEDGKSQPIKSFAEFGPNEDGDTLPNLPPNTYTNREPPPASAAINVFLLDFTNAAPVIPPSVGVPGMEALAGAIAYQRFIKQDAMKYLRGMPEGTRIAVLGASYPGHLRILQGVTSNPALLSAAVDTMEYDTDAMATDYETWCTQQERRNRMTIESLLQVAADLEAIKGRKNLVWFVSDMGPLTIPSLRPSCLSDYNRDLQKVYGLLAAAQVTVFLVSPGPFLSSEAFAEAAGGAALYGSNDLAPLIAKAVDSGSDYYTLSYAPPGSEYDGRHHSIKLEVDKPGLHMTYRESYYAEDPTHMSPAPGLIPGLTLGTSLAANGPVDMRLAMGRSMPSSEQIHFNVHVEPGPMPANASAQPDAIKGTLDPVVKAKLKGKPLTRYSFLYSIPTRQISFTDAPNGSHNGALEVDIAAYDGNGKLITGLSQTVKMPLDDARYKQFLQAPYTFFQQLDLPPGALFVRIGVLDRTSNKVGTLEIPLTVAKSTSLATNTK